MDFLHQHKTTITKYIFIYAFIHALLYFILCMVGIKRIYHFIILPTLQNILGFILKKKKRADFLSILGKHKNKANKIHNSGCFPFTVPLLTPQPLFFLHNRDFSEEGDYFPRPWMWIVNLNQKVGDSQWWSTTCGTGTSHLQQKVLMSLKILQPTWSTERISAIRTFLLYVLQNAEFNLILI